MRRLGVIILSLCFITTLCAQVTTEIKDGPKDEKAQKHFQRGMDYLRERMSGAALDEFKKADKQDGGHCSACQKKIIELGLQLDQWDAAQAAAREVIAQSQDTNGLALAHYSLAVILLQEGNKKHQDDLLRNSHDELTKALTAVPKFPAALFSDGIVLAHLKEDEAAKERFKAFAAIQPEGDANRNRALRYIDDPELARARMAPAFSVTTIDGQHVSLDDLKGKVVLIDFWATWCEPCREALPHVQEIAKKYRNQPFTVLSVSLDTDETKWKSFVVKNKMTWLQYYDNGFTGPIASLFDVHAIPQTFTIDADGILQDQHIGDAAIDGKLKKLISHAQDLQAEKTKPE